MSWPSSRHWSPSQETSSEAAFSYRESATIDTAETSDDLGGTYAPGPPFPPNAHPDTGYIPRKTSCPYGLNRAYTPEYRPFLDYERLPTPPPLVDEWEAEFDPYGPPPKTPPRSEYAEEYCGLLTPPGSFREERRIRSPSRARRESPPGSVPAYHEHDVLESSSADAFWGVSTTASRTPDARQLGPRVLRDSTPGDATGLSAAAQPVRGRTMNSARQQRPKGNDKRKAPSYFDVSPVDVDLPRRLRPRRG